MHEINNKVIGYWFSILDKNNKVKELDISNPYTLVLSLDESNINSKINVYSYSDRNATRNIFLTLLDSSKDNNSLLIRIDNSFNVKSNSSYELNLSISDSNISIDSTLILYIGVSLGVILLALIITFIVLSSKKGNKKRKINVM